MTSEISEESKTTETNNKIKVKELKPKMNEIEIVFRVVGKGEPREVRSRHSGDFHLVADATVGDETGTVSVPLWNESIDDLEIGKTYKLENGYTGLFKGNLQLKIGKYSTLTEADQEIETVNDEVDMSAKNYRTSRDRHYYQRSQRTPDYNRYGGYRPYYGRETRRSSRQNNRRRRW